jgi:PIN domain nuclease of toxin-antitoxin system
MQALLDTNAFLWFISGSDRLSTKPEIILPILKTIWP